LDNLLLTSNGKLFHIDFGYILGRDPKPMPPPMKLSKEMVEAMGGVSSDHHHEFRKQCYTAYLHLRRHANVMLNLFSLMVDATVPDIALEPDKAVKKVEENLQLGLTDEEAVGNFHLRGIFYNLRKQQRFIDELVKLVKLVAKEPGNRNKKTEKFQKLLAEQDMFKVNFTNFEPIPFPLDPEVYITKIVPSRTSLFKSALMPAK